MPTNRSHQQHTKPWYGRVTVEGVVVVLGSFATKEECASAERAFRRKHGMPPLMGVVRREARFRAALEKILAVDPHGEAALLAAEALDV